MGWLALMFIALMGFYFWSEVHRYRALQRIAELAAEADQWPHGEHCTIPGCPHCGGPRRALNGGQE